MKFERFVCKDKEDMLHAAASLGVHIPYSDDTSVLASPLTVGSRTIRNRLAIQPMEGCDGTGDGKPGELTFRRYARFARSGAAIIWGEATAVVPEGRANPRQLYLCPENLASFQRLVESVKEDCLKENGFEPVVVCQLTHSGRYAKPEGRPAPMIACNNPILEAHAPVDPSAVVSDGYLDELGERFGSAARLARLAGFDAADIKCCHRYLLSELCSAYERPGRYGGPFENRTRLYITSLRNALSFAGSDFFVTSRLNLYDGLPYPNGFGVGGDGSTEPDLTEPARLVGILSDELGLPLLNCTIGNPYYNPHVNRPFNAGPYTPPEHPLESVARMFRCIGEIKRQYPRLAIVSSGHTFLGAVAPNAAAGAVGEGIADISGFGREAFAYPQFAGEILSGRFDPRKCCIMCSKCTELMRAGTVAGCVVRDAETYLPYYKKFCRKEPMRRAER